jgi:hypothetical protein
VERPRRVVRFARLIQRRVRALAGLRPAPPYGSNLKPALAATYGGLATPVLVTSGHSNGAL